MSGLFVALIEVFMLVTFFISLPALFVFRLLISIKHKKALTKTILIVILPFSLGYNYFLNEEEKTKFYNVLVKVLFFIALIGISFTLFQLIFPRYDYFI